MKLHQIKNIDKEKDIHDLLKKNKKFKQDREHMLLEAVQKPLFERKHNKETTTLIKKYLNKIVDLADIIVEVLDARDPLSCRNKVVEQKILSQKSKKTNSSKKLVLLINKIDLIPSDVLKCWIKLLEKEFPVIAFSSDFKKQRNSFKKGLNNVNQNIGTDALLALLKKYCKFFDSKGPVYVGVSKNFNVLAVFFISLLVILRQVKILSLIF